MGLTNRALRDPEEKPTTTDLPKKFIVLFLIILVVGLGSIYYSYTSQRSSLDSKQTLDVGGCRTKYRSQVDDAIAQSIASLVDLGVVNLDGLKASIQEDSEELRKLVEVYPATRAEAQEAIGQIETSTSIYLAKVDKSVEDPEAFLAQCRKEAKGG